MKTVTLYLQKVNLYSNDENGTQLARLFDVFHNPQATLASQIDVIQFDPFSSAVLNLSSVSCS